MTLWLNGATTWWAKRRQKVTSIEWPSWIRTNGRNCCRSHRWKPATRRRDTITLPSTLIWFALIFASIFTQMVASHVCVCTEKYDRISKIYRKATKWMWLRCKTVVHASTSVMHITAIRGFLSSLDVAWIWATDGKQPVDWIGNFYTTGLSTK